MSCLLTGSCFSVMARPRMTRCSRCGQCTRTTCTWSRLSRWLTVRCVHMHSTVLIAPHLHCRPSRVVVLSCCCWKRCRSASSSPPRTQHSVPCCRTSPVSTMLPTRRYPRVVICRDSIVLPLCFTYGYVLILQGGTVCETAADQSSRTILRAAQVPCGEHLPGGH